MKPFAAAPQHRTTTRRRKPLRSPILTATAIAGAAVVSWLPAVAHAAGSGPQAYHTLFPNLPAKLIYFEDTPVILSHDAAKRLVWRSADEGRSWNPISGVPEGEAWMVVEHAWDNRVAFVLSKGRKHWRTINGGESWQSWETEEAPALTSTPLSFHKSKWDWIMFTGQRCEPLGGWRGSICYDETWVTQDAFASAPRKLLDHTAKCMWAHSNKYFQSPAPDELVFCIAFDSPDTSDASKSSLGGIASPLAKWLSQSRATRDARLYSSTDFFRSDRTLVDLGLGRESRGLVGMGAVQKYLVAALKPRGAGTPPGSAGKSADSTVPSDEMVMYVSEEGLTWSRAKFPHGHGLKENAYTIVESTPHAVVVDVLTDPASGTGTLFTSNSNGTYFVPSLASTSRNAQGIVDYEKVTAVEGVALANVVANPDEVKGGSEAKKVQTRITFDEGARWSPIKAPARVERHEAGGLWQRQRGRRGSTWDAPCDVGDPQSCSLHLHSVTQPHNFGRVFSSPAPGVLLGVGSVGEYLKPYDECDTWMSDDGGLRWWIVAEGAHKYEVGDQGGVIVLVDDEEPTDKVHYSLDFGKTWRMYDFDVKVRAKLLTGVPDATSQKFLLLGTISKGSSASGKGRQVVIQLDFADMGRRKCQSKDFERWYARKVDGAADCLMGHKQWFHRRKPDADCYVGEKFKEPDSQEENCPCSDEDFECDYNFAPDAAGSCIPAGPEAIPEGQCKNEKDSFMGSSGYRLIPGDTCDRNKGIKKDEPKKKSCSEGSATPGQITHQRHQFDGMVIDRAYFGESHTLLAFTSKNEVWQSSNEGYSWNQPVENTKFISMQMHPYARDRAYLIGPNRDVHYTTDKGLSWNKLSAPLEPNLLGIPLLDFHPTRYDWLIWTGSKNCQSPTSDNCQAVAYYTQNNGRGWNQLDSYVRTCSWGRDKEFKINERLIYCESYRDKKGSQRGMAADNPIRLVSGENFYSSGSRRTLFESVIGFATFEQYMVVATVAPGGSALDLYVSVDGQNFALSKFPPNLRIENQAYTVLESTTRAVFLHVTTHGNQGSEWGTLFKSNSNGTYYSFSLEHVNRNARGFVDFEKMQGLDGIAVMNVVGNPDEAAITGQKHLVTRITHNDGGRWKPLPAPAKDALGQAYPCSSTACSLHIHGYTERSDPRATYSSPSAVGLMMAVGNVGHSLAPYTESDTFLTRDGGFTWQEVSKDAHLWEYGDQGSILVLANDEGPTDRVKYTLDEGLTWDEYVFGEPVRVKSIVTVPDDTSRKFILFGFSQGSMENTIAVHLDFSKITNQKCVLDTTDPNNDDFELWSPSESREQQCLFGRQTLYYRRVRQPKRPCYVGEKIPQPHKIQRNCQCTEEDFECDFNYRRDPSTGRCVLVEGAQPRANDASVCAWDQDFWFDRTAYRKIPYSTCEGGLSLDRGNQHVCPAGRARTHGWLWWSFFVVVPCLFVGLAGFWWMRRRGYGAGAGRTKRRGAIALPDPGYGNGAARGGSGSGDLVETLASVPWFLVGVGTALYGYVVNLPIITRWFGGTGRQGYRQVRLDDDAELLQDYED